MNPRLLPCLILAAAQLCVPAGAAAQGNGHAYGQNKNRPPAPSPSGASGPSAGGAPEIQVAGTGVRNFGAWLDDASVLAPGQGFVSVGVSLWKMPGYRELDLPTIDSAIGVHRRIQFGASVPFYHANEPGGAMARGMGTMYLSAKVQLREPSQRGLGVSVTPAMEVLSLSPGLGTDRVSWALPVNVELQRSGWRAYGSTGYFSRRALFASAAVEKTLSDRAWLTGSITHAYSMDPDPLSFALGLAQTHTDVNVGAAVSVRQAVAVFGSLGRTISKKDANAADLVLTGGVSLGFNTR